MNKSNHGGARKGAGRKKNSGSFKEETKVIRVPVSLVTVSYTHLTLPTILLV